MMSILDLIKAINRLKVETGSLTCLGCGHEHDCSVHGCAILREAADQLDAYAGTFGEQTVLVLAAQALNSTPERLRELADADKKGRLMTPPVKVGDKLYSVTYDEVLNEYVIGDPEEIVEVGTRGFFFAWKMDINYPEEFHPYEEIGQEFFLTFEDALRAKERLEGVQGDG